MFELHNTDEDTTTSTQMGLLGRKPESLYLSVHYSACLHHFLLVHKLPGYQDSLMGVCLTPNQFNRCIFEPSVCLFSRHYWNRFSLFHPSLCKNTCFLERVEGPRWPRLQRQELCVGGALCPPHPLGLLHLSSSRSRPPVSWAVQVKCQHGDRDRDSRVPSNTWDGSKSWQPQRRWSKRGVEEQERITRGRERSRSLAGDTSAQHSRQTRKAARQQCGDESSARAAWRGQT